VALTGKDVPFTFSSSRKTYRPSSTAVEQVTSLLAYKVLQQLFQNRAVSVSNTGI